MIETLLKAAEVTAMKSIENFGKSFEFKLPDFFQNKQEVTDAVLDARAEAAAHSASKFFNLPEAKIQKGATIGVYKNGEGTFLDDVFEYNLEQFKKMNCTSFEDMTKVWAHECGHRLLQNIFPNSWADELGADFFAGARSEMMGLPKSNFEKMLGSTNASKSHPGGALRMKAMDYGRFVVTQMKKAGIQPTWENCIEAYRQSPFAKMTYENTGKDKATGFIDNKAYHYGNAADAQAKVNSNLKRSQEAAARGDYSQARDYARSASRWQTTVKDETKAANRSTKLVDDNPVEGNSEITSFVNDRAWHLKNAEQAKANAEYYLNESKKAAARGDYGKAKDHAKTAESYSQKAKDEVSAANSSTK